MSEKPQSRAMRASWRARPARFVVMVVVLSALAIWALPLGLASDALRNHVILGSLGALGDKVEARADHAVFGWTPPTTVRGLQLVSRDERLSVLAKEVRIGQAWWQLLLFSDRLAHVDVDQPTVQLQMSGHGWSDYSAESIPTLTANLRNANLTVQLEEMSEPVIALSDVNLELAVERCENDAFVVVRRGRVFDRRPLTPRMCDHLLQLMDPALGEVVQVEGNFSLDIKTLRLPLDIASREQLKRIEVEAALHLHEVTTRAKTPLLKKVLRVTSDLYGKQPSDVVRVVQDNQVTIEVRDGRIYHDRLELGIPEISSDLTIHSHGSVGLDESLDLHLTIPEILVTEKPETVEHSATVQYRVTGTVNDPKIVRVPDDSGVASDQPRNEEKK